ncbi:MAG TPA: SMC-Scp complex subunit ScpB, partial [Clostridia bacterium]|nr:SMC-Scp complex subunit ScpB [Clostridia bacterium]
MRNERLCGIIEAILFVCGDALEMDELANVLGHTSEAIQAAVEDLEALLAAGYRGVQVKRFGSKVQLVS